MRRALAAVLAVLALPGVAAAQTVPAATVPRACAPTAAALAPDARVPLALTLGTTTTTDGVDETPIHFRSGSQTIAGVLVRSHAPAASGTRAGVLWVHWLGEAATTNHTEFLADARALAVRGTASVLIDAMWSAPDWFQKDRSTTTDACDALAQVQAIRRALDVLGAQPDVDAKRIGYVGHDFGAMYGALALAVDTRPAAAVFMTPTISFWEWFLLGTPPAAPAAYHAAMAAYDLPPWLARTHARAALLQFGKRDFYVSSATAIAFRNAVPAAGRTYTMYDADHALAEPAVTADRRAWLAEHLALPKEVPSEGKP